MIKRTLAVKATPAALAVACLLSVGCAHAQETIKIGVPTAISGPNGVYYNQVKRAMDFAVAQVNAKGGLLGGRKVELKYADSESKADPARKQAEKLALDGYKLLIGTHTTPEMLAIAPNLERWDALYVSSFARGSRLTADACQPRLFRVNQSDPIVNSVLKPFIDSRKEKKWAVLAYDNAFGHDGEKGFRTTLENTDKTIVATLFQPAGTNDFAPYIQQIKASGAEALFVVTAGTDAINFLTQARQFGLFDTMMIAGNSYIQDAILKAAGAAAKDAFGDIVYSPLLETPENKDFVAEFKKFYNGDTPTDTEAQAYDGLWVYFQAIAKAKSDKPADLAKVLEGGTFDTLYGQSTIRPEDHQMILPMYFGQVRVDGTRAYSAPILTIGKDKATPAPDPACKLPRG